METIMIIKRARIKTFIFVTSALLAVTGCVSTPKLDQSTRFDGRPVATLNHPRFPMQGIMERADYSQSGMLGIPLMLGEFAVMDSSGAISDAKSLPQPSFDPAKVIEKEISSKVIARYGARDGGELTLSDKYKSAFGEIDIAKLSAEARSKGFHGLLIDFDTLSFNARVKNAGLSFGKAVVVFEYSAKFSLIDVDQSKLLASAFCAIEPEKGADLLHEAAQGGQALVNARVQDLANRCASKILSDIITVQ